MYKSKYSFHCDVFRGGNIPENSCHSVIDKPESVNLVKPQTMIIIETIEKIVANQLVIYFFNIFFSMYIL